MSHILPRLVVLAIIGIVWGFVAADTLRQDRVGLQFSDDDVVQVQDFASIVEFSGAVLNGTLPAAGESSAYTPGSHRHFMEEWSGSPQEHALPFGYSPTMVWIAGLLALLPLGAAYLVWTGLGYGATAALLLRGRVPALGALVFLLSPVAVAAVALGQTAILSTAVLLVLALASASPGGREVGWITSLPLAALLWPLTAKPPIGLTAAAGLLAARRYRAVIVAGAMALATAAFTTPLLGAGWPTDYLALLNSYNQAEADSLFAWSLRPDLMSNLRAFLAVDLGVADSVASTVSNTAFLMALALVVAGSWRGLLAPAHAWSFAVLAYLLLASHVSFTEDLALFTVPALMESAGPRAGRVRFGAWALATAAVLLSPAIGPAAAIRPALPFFLKVALFGWLAWLAWLARQEPASAPQDSAVHG